MIISSKQRSVKYLAVYIDLTVPTRERIKLADTERLNLITAFNDIRSQLELPEDTRFALIDHLSETDELSETYLSFRVVGPANQTVGQLHIIDARALPSEFRIETTEHGLFAIVDADEPLWTTNGSTLLDYGRPAAVLVTNQNPIFTMRGVNLSQVHLAETPPICYNNYDIN